ncbi:MAG TPA: T9SS type A sorting domain-containing protein, partial [Bacteroidia bacterium]|nr:T9SS type A sorting domain-containing protein [Bacteroidia bacterium]
GEIYNQVAGARDMFVMTMDSSGNTLWDTSINAGDYFNVAINRMDIVNDALITAAGTIVLTGWYMDGVPSPRWVDLGIDLHGTTQWVWENPSGTAHGYSVAEKPGDQVVTAGRVTTAQGVATGITVFDSIGAIVWSALYTTPQTVNVYEQQVGTDHLGNVYCAAWYNDTSHSSVFLIKYSFLASVTDPTGPGLFVSVFPNPASNQLTIQAQMPGDELTFTMTDANGKLILSSTIANPSGMVQMQLDVSFLAAGMYFIRVSGEGASQTKELVIAR